MVPLHIYVCEYLYKNIYTFAYVCAFSGGTVLEHVWVNTLAPSFGSIIALLFLLNDQDGST